MLAVGVIGVVIVALIALLVAGGGSSSKTPVASSSDAIHHHAPRAGKRAGTNGAARAGAATTVALSLKASAVVYVCLIGDDGHKLIPGTELQPGASTPTFRARRFQLTLGNNAVTMIVDGIPRTVPPSSEAIGYTITKADGRQPLAPGQLPTCT
jgi:hypothetical protein